VRIIFTGGGTGGHIYPALALAAALKETDNHSILFVGTKKGMEKDIVPQAGYQLETITVSGLERKLSLRTFRTFTQLGMGLWQAWSIIRRFRPQIVVGTGGYVSVPLVLLAAWLKIPTLIHEQNALPGAANRFLSRFAQAVAISYAGSKGYFPRAKRLIVTGNPVRKEVLQLTREEGRKTLGIAADKKVVLVFGGSRGARPINEAVMAAIPALSSSSELVVYYITGPGDYKYVCSSLHLGIEEHRIGNIIIKPYLHDMPAALAAADLVVARAGATTLAELTARGIPAILIPSPYVTDNHQEHNARLLEKAGAAVLIRERELKGEYLAESILNLVSDPLRLAQMAEASFSLGRRGAREELLALVRELVKE
jgi:UDP-N-acetylglucosamine--N-acetylmuramyl-(pentapeptide) pyrophosphoryl-undecaprenol N-acetylglucosamine transferase